MLFTDPTRSPRELYDCAPDYLDGEEEIEEADKREAEEEAELEYRRKQRVAKCFRRRSG